MSRKLTKIGMSWAFGIRTTMSMLVFGAVRSFAAFLPWDHWRELNDFMDGVIDRSGSLERRGRNVVVEESLTELGGRLEAELRPGTSDFAVWRQIVHLEEFAVVSRLLADRSVRTILDAGANIGLTSLYLARAFPEARILALEPDEANHALLVENLREFSNRVECVKGAFWPIDEGLRMSAVPFRDGREWAGRVERGHSAGDVSAATDVRVLTPQDADVRLGGHGFDLLKMDIEGAESEFFADADHTRDLLARCGAITIEVHAEHIDPHAVLRVLDASGFLVFSHMELLIGLKRERGEAG